MPCLEDYDFEEIQRMVARDLFEGRVVDRLLEVVDVAERTGIEVPGVVTRWKGDLEELRLAGRKMPGSHPFGTVDGIPSIENGRDFKYPEGWIFRMVSYYRHDSIGASMLCAMCHRLLTKSLLETCSGDVQNWWAERGGPAFLDRGISGFVAGPNRRNQVHEEATT
jgi:hypothetical protein